MKLGIQLQPKISISNTKKKILQYLNIILVGWHLCNANKTLPKNHNEAWQLSTTKTRTIKDFLEQIIPHLIIKKKQGELLLEYCESRIKEIYEKGISNAHYTGRELEIAKELQRLNKRGKAKL